MYKLLLLSLLLFPFSSPAQCDPALMESKEHGWAKTTDGLTSNAGPYLPKEKATVQKIAEIVQALYPKPKGAEGFWYGYYNGKSIDKQYSKPFSANVILKTYQCINNKEVLNTGYSGSVFININGLGDMGETMKLNDKEYSIIHAFATSGNGSYYFNFNYREDNESHEGWLITYKDKLPFTFMSRKEYLVEAKAEQTRNMEEMIVSVKDGHRIRPQAEQDAERQKEIDYYKEHYKGSALESMLARFNKDYRSDQQKQDNAIAETRKGYQRLFDVVDNNMNNSSPEYLAQPAVVLPYGTYSFKSFEENLKDINADYIIRDNPAYYNKNLPASAPQYMVVIIRHSNKNNPCRTFYYALNQKTLFDNLFNLLGK